MKFRDVFEEEIEVIMDMGFYPNHRISFQLYEKVGEWDWEPYGTLTKSLPEYQIGSDEGFLDTNNMPGAEVFVKEYQLAVPTGRSVISGYCIYPLYRFDLDRIAALIKEEREKYDL